MKRLITCSDGTWNKPGEKDGRVEANTNVYKIYQCVSESAIQKKFYDKGVGCGHLEDKIMGGLTGAGIDQNIKDVYTFLVQNFEPGDEIWLFGFSRGAYTARSAAGFIRNCGILRREYIDKIDEAFELYRERGDSSAPDAEKSIVFRQNYSLETNIKFIGVWDTVGSLGIPVSWFQSFNARRYKFHDTTLSSHVQYAYHALAIDERRSVFKPTFWEKSKTVVDDPTHQQQMEQRWFSGAHSNVGGGYADCGLSDLALEWMIEKAKAADLQFISDKCESIRGCYDGKLRDSYTFMYALWPRIWRSILNDDVITNQTIHTSVWKLYDTNKSYRPANLKR